MEKAKPINATDPAKDAAAEEAHKRLQARAAADKSPDNKPNESNEPRQPAHQPGKTSDPNASQQARPAMSGVGRPVDQRDRDGGQKERMPDDGARQERPGEGQTGGPQAEADKA